MRASARVSLDSLLVSDPCIVGLEPRRSPSASLAEQVPALIERDLDLSEPLTVGIGYVRVRFSLEELVFLARKLVDPAEYLRVVHGASSHALRLQRIDVIVGLFDEERLERGNVGVGRLGLLSLGGRVDERRYTRPERWTP